MHSLQMYICTSILSTSRVPFQGSQHKNPLVQGGTYKDTDDEIDTAFYALYGTDFGLNTTKSLNQSMKVSSVG
jgi:hypothetical protein